MRDEARQEGYKAGYAAGQAAAQAEANRLADAATSLEQALAEFDQQVADELLALATEIARQVVREEISARPDTIVKVVQEALAQLPHQHATIFLHPDDASLVRSYVGDALAHAGHRLLEDARLSPGDCILESGSSQSDATLATRWRRVIETLGLSNAWHAKDEQ
jgi:flagellar assembly protein FliH